MIVVVEGVSAAGKSTWCHKHGADNVVAETRAVKPPCGDAASRAAFWVTQNASRWAQALAMEKANNPAICDTDPLKLHYAWSLWRIGEASEDRWRTEWEATRQAIRDRRIGFADHYIVGEVSPNVVRERRDSDATRRRRNFELHVRLQPFLLEWYRTLSMVLPCEVCFGFPTRAPRLLTGNGTARYDLGLFDKAVARLPRS